MSYNTTQRVEWIDQCEFEKDGWRTPSKLILMSDFGGTKAGKVDGGSARCIGPCTYIVEPLLERPLFYQLSRWENFNISYVLCFVEFEVLGVAHICNDPGDGLTIEGTKNSPPLWFNWILESTFWVCGSLEVEKMQRELVFLLFKLVQVIWNFLIACSQC